MPNTDCEECAKSDYSILGGNFLSSCTDSLQFSHQNAFLNPKMRNGALTAHSQKTGSVICTTNLSVPKSGISVSRSPITSWPSAAEGVLDLSTRKKYEILPTKKPRGSFDATEDIQKSKDLSLSANPRFCNQDGFSPADILQTALSWIPSYNLMLATREYLNILFQISATTTFPTSVQDETVNKVTLGPTTVNHSARLHFDHLLGPQSEKLTVTDEMNYRSIPEGACGETSTTSVLPSSFALPNSSLVTDPVFGLVFNNTLPNRYSPPLNFSAFTSVDQNMICPICRKCFRFEKNLLRHLQKTHSTGTGESVLKCKLCNYTTRHYSNMYVHIRTHTGDKPYSCAACGVSFTQGSSLKLHIRSRHGDNTKYFSLTRKPGKNNLTKLWTRVLKKDLPKYNLAMANTLLNRSKIWSRSDLEQNRLLGNIFSRDHFGWNLCKSGSIVRDSAESVDRMTSSNNAKVKQSSANLETRPRPSIDTTTLQSLWLDTFTDFVSNYNPNVTVEQPDTRDTPQRLLEPKWKMKQYRSDRTESITTPEYDDAGDHSKRNIFYANHQNPFNLPKVKQSYSPLTDSCISGNENCHACLNSSQFRNTTGENFEDDLELNLLPPNLPYLPNPEYLYAVSQGENYRSLGNVDFEKKIDDLRASTSEYIRKIENY